MNRKTRRTAVAVVAVAGALAGAPAALPVGLPGDDLLAGVVAANPGNLEPCPTCAGEQSLGLPGWIIPGWATPDDTGVLVRCPTCIESPIVGTVPKPDPPAEPSPPTADPPAAAIAVDPWWSGIDLGSIVWWPF